MKDYKFTIHGSDSFTTHFFTETGDQLNVTFINGMVSFSNEDLHLFSLTFTDALYLVTLLNTSIREYE